MDVKTRVVLSSTPFLPQTDLHTPSSLPGKDLPSHYPSTRVPRCQLLLCPVLCHQVTIQLVHRYMSGGNEYFMVSFQGILYKIHYTMGENKCFSCQALGNVPKPSRRRHHEPPLQEGMPMTMAPTALWHQYPALCKLKGYCVTANGSVSE